MNKKSKYSRFLEALNVQLVLHEGRYRAADSNEDSLNASSEAGFCAALEEAMDLFRSIVLEVSGNE